MKGKLERSVKCNRTTALALRINSKCLDSTQGPVRHHGIYHLVAMQLRSEYDSLDEVRGTSVILQYERAHTHRA